MPLHVGPRETTNRTERDLLFTSVCVCAGAGACECRCAGAINERVREYKRERTFSLIVASLART